MGRVTSGKSGRCSIRVLRLSIFSAKDQTEVERLTAADPIILDDVGARYEILPMKQLRMKAAS
jgi:hypothetical protein